MVFFLQTLILAKVTPRSLKNTPSPDKNIDLPSINQDPLSSNIYSVGERIILSWLNHHYETYRERIWTGCSKGVNLFDNIQPPKICIFPFLKRIDPNGCKKKEDKPINLDVMFKRFTEIFYNVEQKTVHFLREKIKKNCF